MRSPRSKTYLLTMLACATLALRSVCVPLMRRRRKMSDEDISKLLEKMLRSEHAPPLTDSVVDAFLASEAECPDEMVDRVRACFVEKVLADLHRTPVKRGEGKLSFGRWVEQAREGARLSRHDLGSALDKDQSFVESVETGGTQPWHMKSRELARIVSLFRLHIDAVSGLILCSFALNNVR